MKKKIHLFLIILKLRRLLGLVDQMWNGNWNYSFQFRVYCYQQRAMKSSSQTCGCVNKLTLQLVEGVLISHVLDSSFSILP